MTGKLEHYRVFCKVAQNRSFSKAAQELDDGKIFEVQLRNPIPERSIGMVSLSGVSLSPAVSRFLELLQNQN